MRILALDTATRACSVALWQDGKIRRHRLRMMDRGHSEALMPMVVEIMGNVDFGDLDLLAVTTGPGAFTGLRIGLAAARGMALAAGVPCAGVTTLEAVAHAVPRSERTAPAVLVILESKRTDVFAQVFDPSLVPLTEPQAVAPEGVASLLPLPPPGGPSAIVVAGDAQARVLPVLAEAGFEPMSSSAPAVPDAAAVAAIAAARWRPDLALDDNFAPLAPLYLRPPDAKPAKNGGRLRP